MTAGLLILATVPHGFLAGGNVEQALVHMPAWRKLGLPPPLPSSTPPWCAPLLCRSIWARLWRWPALAITQAAPELLSLHKLGDDDLAALQRAFDGFEFCGNTRKAGHSLRRAGPDLLYRRPGGSRADEDLPGL